MVHVVTRRRTALLSSLTAAGVAAGVALLAVPGAFAARAASVRACSASQLVETLSVNRGGGTAGTYYDTLHFTNLGSTCSLRGYPGVSAVSVGGRQLGHAAVHDGGSERTVTLRGVTSTSASSASATIGFVDTGALSGCDQRLAAGLRVYAPNTSSAKYVPFVVDACSKGSDTFLRIGPVS